MAGVICGHVAVEKLINHLEYSRAPGFSTWWFQKSRRKILRDGKEASATLAKTLSLPRGIDHPASQRAKVERTAIGGDFNSNQCGVGLCRLRIGVVPKVLSSGSLDLTCADLLLLPRCACMPRELRSDLLHSRESAHEQRRRSSSPRSASRSLHSSLYIQKPYSAAIFLMRTVITCSEASLSSDEALNADCFFASCFSKGLPGFLHVIRNRSPASRSFGFSCALNSRP